MQLKTNVIGYSRVSTAEQKDGFSLDYQHEAITKYCNNKNLNLLQIYVEDHSAFKGFDRPEWNKLEEYIKKNRKLVNEVICLRWDRFSRNHAEGVFMIKKLAKLGVQIRMIDGIYSEDETMGTVLNSLAISLAEAESKNNRKRTMDSTRKALLSGYWIYKPPLGYQRSYTPTGRATIAIDPIKSGIIRKVFEQVATGLYSADEVRRKHFLELEKMSKNNFNLLLRRVVYIGKIKVNKTEREAEKVVRGIHDPIISDDLFQMVQDFMDGRKIKRRSNEQNVDRYPYKAFLDCNEHGRTFTGSGSKGRNDIYHYYHCTKSRCKHRFSEAKMDELFAGILYNLIIPEEVINLYNEILDVKLEEKTKFKKKELGNLDEKKNQLQNKLEKIQEDYFSGAIDGRTLMEFKTKLELELGRVISEIDMVKSNKEPFRELFEKTLRILPNLDEYFRNASGDDKQRILGSIFSGKIEFEKMKVRTIPYKPFIQQILLINRGLEGCKKEKASKNADLYYNAPPLGLEPRTL